MRRVIVVLAAVVAIAALVSAGSPAGGATHLKVGLVVDFGVTPSNRNIVALPYLGFVRAVRTLGVQGRVVRVAPNEDPTNALRFLARQRYDLVVLGIPAPPEAIDSVAVEFPSIKFLLPDYSRLLLANKPKNVQGTVFRAGEAAYLAGYLAALMETLRPGKDVVGTVGGFKFAGVDRWIVAFQAGARHANPHVTTLNAYTNDFSAPRKCHAAALNQIAKGAGVVFQVAGGCGLGTLQAAKEKHVWGVGVDVDESYLGQHVLTSAMVRDDNAVFRAIQKLVRGTFRTGGDTVFDLANGGVMLGKINPKVPRSFLQRLERVRRDIVAGRIRPPRVT